jgi:hypothetical protein
VAGGDDLLFDGEGGGHRNLALNGARCNFAR